MIVPAVHRRAIVPAAGAVRRVAEAVRVCSNRVRPIRHARRIHLPQEHPVIDGVDVVVDPGRRKPCRHHHRAGIGVLDGGIGQPQQLDIARRAASFGCIPLASQVRLTPDFISIDRTGISRRHRPDKCRIGVIVGRWAFFLARIARPFRGRSDRQQDFEPAGIHRLHHQVDRLPVDRALGRLI